MFQIIRNNMIISKGDNALFEVSLCGEPLKEGDRIVFESPEQETTVTEFNDGKALIQIDSSEELVNDKYSIHAYMTDGRICLIAEGKFIRKGGRS